MTKAPSVRSARIFSRSDTTVSDCQRVPDEGIAFSEDTGGVVNRDVKIADTVATGNDVVAWEGIDSSGEEIDPDGVSQRLAANVLQDHRAGFK